MRRIEFGIGIGEDKYGRRITLNHAHRMICDALTMLIDHGQRGGFITPGFRFWKASDGRVAREEAITITLDSLICDEAIPQIADNLRRIFNQESIHIAIFDVDARNT